MRAVKRWLRYHYAEYRIAGRRADLAKELCRHFGTPIVLGNTGSSGRDSVYFVHSAEGIAGVVRLANPHKHRRQPAGNLPFAWQEDRGHLAREWNAYTRGARHGLTPAPLWRVDDALMCSFVPGRRLHARFLENRSRFWDLACAATRALERLHRAGTIHMDCSFANIIAADRLEPLTFIDFEYGANPRLSFVQQKAYDYLRLVESGLKFLPPGTAGFSRWVETLADCVDAQTRAADLDLLAPALTRILQVPEYRRGLRRVFQGLPAGGQS